MMSSSLVTVTPSGGAVQRYRCSSSTSASICGFVYDERDDPVPGTTTARRPSMNAPDDLAADRQGVIRLRGGHREGMTYSRIGEVLSCPTAWSTITAHPSAWQRHLT